MESDPEHELTHLEWLYLQARYPDRAQFQERLDRIMLLFRRLVRKGHDPERVHRAWMAGIEEWEKHRSQQMDHHAVSRRNRAVAKVRRDIDHALAGLRALLPKEVRASIPDTALWEQRELVLRLSVAAPPPTRPVGRPWEWKQTTDSRLKDATLTEADRREFLAAVGFLADDD